MAQNVDFLPEKYRQRTAVRHTKLWRLAVVALFGSVIAATSLFQWGLRRKVHSQLAIVETSYLEAQAKATRHTQLQNVLDREAAAARLYTYLRHPWPTSQVIAAIVNPLPDSITLTEMRIHYESPRATSRRRIEANGESEEEDRSKLMPSQQDLLALQEEFDDTRFTVNLTGVTRQTAQLHQYLVLLGQSPMIDRAELHSLESVESGKQKGYSRFNARITVPPGYGQRGGPRGAADVARAAESQRGDGAR